MAFKRDRRPMRSVWAEPSGAVVVLVAAVRRVAREGVKQLKSVVDDYEFDRSRWSAGPRRAVALIGLRVRVECVFILPVALVPGECEVRIDTCRGWGCWLAGGGIDCEDPEDVMRLAFEDQRQLLSEVVLEALMGRHRFRTLRGLSELRRRYRAGGFVYRAGTDGLRVCFTAEMEAW